MHYFILYIAFGILPSLIWLFYYLRKDLHPEPKRMILKIFLYGALIALPVFLIQLGLSNILEQAQTFSFFHLSPTKVAILKWFIIIALTEEVSKYLVVKFTILDSDELDEPLDIMLYMVVVALGFAALENILYLLLPIDHIMPLGKIIGTTITISSIRFIGATFLHTLCSALLGYFIVKSVLENRNKLYITIIGIILVTLLHGLYDFSIITLQDPFSFIIPSAIILVLVIFMIYDFDSVKKIKGICKI